MGAKLGIEEKGYVILGQALGGTGCDDEAGEFSVKGLGGVRGQWLVDGTINQLVVSLSKIITPVEDHHGATLIGGEDNDIRIGTTLIGSEDNDIRIGAQGVKSRTFSGAD